MRYTKSMTCRANHQVKTGAWLRGLREGAGLTRAELAEEAGYTVRRLEQLEAEPERPLPRKAARLLEIAVMQRRERTGTDAA